MFIVPSSKPPKAKSQLKKSKPSDAKLLLGAIILFSTYFIDLIPIDNLLRGMLCLIIGAIGILLMLVSRVTTEESAESYEVDEYLLRSNKPKRKITSLISSWHFLILIYVLLFFKDYFVGLID